METHPKFKAVEQAVYTPSSLQDGNPCCHHSVPQEGSLGHHLGFKGCIPACTHSSSSSAVSLLQLQRGRLCFQGDAVRPLDSTPSIYQDHQDGYRLPQTSGYHSICLSRRLANSIQVPSRSPEGYQLHDSSPTVPGLDHQRGEVFSHPITAPHVLGSSSRPFPGHSVPVGGQTSCHLGPSCCHPIGGSVPSPRLVTSLGTDGEPRRCRSFLPPQNEALTIAHASAVPTVHGCTVQSDRHDIGCQASCRMVDVTTQFNEGQAFPRPQGESSNNDGCVTLGLGRNLGVRDSLRPVVYTGEVSAHKLVGDGSSKESHSPLEVTSSQQVPDNSDGQLNGSFLPQSSRRDKVNNPVHAHTQPAFRGRRHKSPDQGLPSSRERKCGRRRPVKGLDNGPKGVDSLAGVGRSRVRVVRTPPRGSFCDSRERPTSNVLLPVLPPSSVVGGRPVHRLERDSGLRLSSLEPHSSRSDKAQGLSGVIDSHRPFLAKTAVVPPADTTSSRQSIQVSTKGQPTHPTSRQNSASGCQKPSTFCMATLRRNLEAKGLSQEAVDIASRSRRNSTLHIYDSRVCRFRDWAVERGVNPLEAPLDQVADFLVSLFREGKQVRTVRNYRSAIASIHLGFPDGTSVGNNPTIGQLLRGMFHTRPPQRRLPPTWSINAVLESLSRSPFEPLAGASLEDLTKKTLFLLAAASARRRSCLHALTVKEGFIRFEPGGVRLLPDPAFLAKNQSVNFTPDEIFLPAMEQISSIPEDYLVCPVRALRAYIKRTKPLRAGDRLFILPKVPHPAASKDTLSRWIRSLILPHVQTSEPVRAHDVRAHATSKAWFAGVPLEEVIRAAAWKTPSSFVSHYLTNTVSAEGSFARTVLTRKTNHHRHHSPVATRGRLTTPGQSGSSTSRGHRKGSSVRATPPTSRC